MIEEIDRCTEAYLEALDATECEVPAQSMAAGGEQNSARIQSRLATLDQMRRECAAIPETLASGPGGAAFTDRSRQPRAAQEQRMHRWLQRAIRRGRRARGAAEGGYPIHRAFLS